MKKTESPPNNGTLLSNGFMITRTVPWSWKTGQQLFILSEANRIQHFDLESYIVNVQSCTFYSDKSKHNFWRYIEYTYQKEIFYNVILSLIYVPFDFKTLKTQYFASNISFISDPKPLPQPQPQYQKRHC